MRWAASDVSPSSHLAFHIPNTCRVLFVLCCVLGLGVLLLCCVFGFLFCKCFGIPNSPRSLDLDDRQGLIASSAMQQKKNKKNLHSPPSLILRYRYLTPLLVVAPLDGTQTPFFQHSYLKVISLGYNKLVLHL